MKQDLTRLMLLEDIATILEYMREHGQSVLLNWGEDDNLWECSWITGGDRFTGFSNRSPRSAALACMAKVKEAVS